MLWLLLVATLFFTLLFAAALVALWRGVAPPVHPSPWTLWAKALLAAPPALLVYLLAVRAQLRGGRG